MNQTRAFWILVALACANFVCVPVHAEKEAALNVTDDFSATEPDVVVHYRETYAAFPDIIRLHDGNLLMVTREGTHHMEDPEHGRVVGRISTDAGRTWGEATVITFA